MRKTWWPVIVFLAMSSAVSLSPATAGTVSTVVVVGSPSPDGSPFVNFGNFEVGGSGVVVVRATTRSLTTKRLRHCLFKLEPGGGGTALACLKEPSPVSGLTYRNITRFSVNADGTAAWAAVLSNGRPAILREGPNVVALGGDALAGGASLASLANPTITNGGAVVFSADVNSDLSPVFGTDQGIFRCAGTCPGGAGLETLLRFPAGLPDRIDEILCDIVDVAASDWGIAFRATFNNTVCSIHLGIHPTGVFRMQYGGTVESVALEGEVADPAPPSAGARYFTFSTPDIHDGGVVAFRATTRDFGLPGGAAIYLCDPATCPVSPAEIAVGAGSTDDRGRILTGLSAPRLSKAGDVAFNGRGQGEACDVYIRRYVDGTVETVVSRGDPAPVDAESVFRCPGVPIMSSDGTVAFPAAYMRTSKPRKGEGIFLVED